VRVDPLESAAEELAGAQVGGLEEVRLLPGPYRLHHLALAVVIQALEEERREPPAAALAGRNRHWPPPRGEVRPRSTAPLRAATVISSSVRPEEAVTVMLCLRPVCTSMAETETMPSAEMSKMTSMSTSPRLALRSPVIMNSPSSSFWAAISLSPCSTVIFAEV